MKKVWLAGISAVMATGAVLAQSDMVMVGQMDDAGYSEVETTVEVGLFSSYVWRGQVLNNDAVIQPQVTVAQYGVSINIWGNYDLGSNLIGVSSDFSEIDFSLAYTLPVNLNEISFDVGLIGYHFPANGQNALGQAIGAPSTTELYAKGTVQSFKDYYIIPSVTFYGDIDEADGVYILFDVAAPYEVSDYLTVEGGVSAGWGNTRYNDYYFGGSQDAGFNDYNIYANASYEVMENLTVMANATVTFLEGGSLRDAAQTIYEDKDKFWCGVGVAYDF